MPWPASSVGARVGRLAGGWTTRARSSTRPCPRASRRSRACRSRCRRRWRAGSSWTPAWASGDAAASPSAPGSCRGCPAPPARRRRPARPARARARSPRSRAAPRRAHRPAPARRRGDRRADVRAALEAPLLLAASARDPQRGHRRCAGCGGVGRRGSLDRAHGRSSPREDSGSPDGTGGGTSSSRRPFGFASTSALVSGRRRASCAAAPRASACRPERPRRRACAPAAHASASAAAPRPRRRAGRCLGGRRVARRSAVSSAVGAAADWRRAVARRRRSARLGGAPADRPRRPVRRRSAAAGVASRPASAAGLLAAGSPCGGRLDGRGRRRASAAARRPPRPARPSRSAGRAVRATGSSTDAGRGASGSRLRRCARGRGPAAQRTLAGPGS